MKTSWTETAKIEDYLLEQEDTENCLLIEARLQLDTALMQQVKAQKMSYALIHEHGRQLLLKEIKAAEHKVFHQKRYRSFKERVLSFFR